MEQMNPSVKQKQTHRHREQACGCQGWGVGGSGMASEFGVSRHKLLHVEWISNKLSPTVQHGEPYPVSWDRL